MKDRLIKVYQHNKCSRLLIAVTDTQWKGLTMGCLAASSRSKQTRSIRCVALTETLRLNGFLLYIHLVVMADADAAVYLVEQGGAQVGELGGGNERVRVQAIVGEELSQIQALDGGEHKRRGDWEKSLYAAFKILYD